MTQENSQIQSTPSTESENFNTPPTNHIKLLGNSWIGLIDVMGTEVKVTNAARVSFGKMKTEMDESDVKLLKYLIKNRHSSPLEHMSFTFSIKCPLFVRAQWHRHRTWKFSEISRRYTEENIEFFIPETLREQAKDNKQASISSDKINQESNLELIRGVNKASFIAYEELLKNGVCREQARGVLPQNMLTTFWGTVDLHNLIGFLLLRDDSHAQEEIRVYAKAIKELIRPIVPHVMEVLDTGKFYGK